MKAMLAGTSAVTKHPNWSLVVAGGLLTLVGVAIFRFAPVKRPNLPAPLTRLGLDWFDRGTGAKVMAWLWIVPGFVIAVIGLIL